MKDMALSFELIRDLTTNTIESARLVAVRATHGYTHVCIGDAITELTKDRSGSVSRLLQNLSVNIPELKRAIEHTLL
jgi:hypothetical protein